MVLVILTGAISVEGWTIIISQLGKMTSTCTCTCRVSFLPMNEPSRSWSYRSYRCTSMAATDDKNNGYKFGDITKSIGKRVTGDENYKVCICIGNWYWYRYAKMQV